MNKKELTPNEYRSELEYQLANAKINATSPYNDGWTQEGYQKKVIELELKLSKIGKQLNFDFK
jgi:hypothetical protein